MNRRLEHPRSHCDQRERVGDVGRARRHAAQGVAFFIFNEKKLTAVDVKTKTQVLTYMSDVNFFSSSGRNVYHPALFQKIMEFCRQVTTRTPMWANEKDNARKCDKSSKDIFLDLLQFANQIHKHFMRHIFGSIS